MTLPVGARASEGCQRREAGNNKQLLPRIPDDVTLNLITPKLSWGDCHRLSSVSRAWRYAIRSRQVHDARIRLQSTETLILLTYKPSKFPLASVVYSMRDNQCYKLPPFPYPDGRMPPPFEIRPTFQCVQLDGKVYVLGGEFMPDELSGNSCLYALDLAAGGRQWKQCKSMIEPRAHFGCGVLDGKIYVFGGLSSTSPVCGSEVYDPKEDTWSPIKAMRCLRFDHQVATVGTELVVHGGNISEPMDSHWNTWIRAHRGIRHFPQPVVAEYGRAAILLVSAIAKEANSLDVYDAIKDEWSVVEGPRGREEVITERKLSFIAKGKYHVMNCKDIQVHDTETNSWARLHSNPIFDAALRLLDCKLQNIVLRVAVAVDDKLLAIVEGVDKNRERKQAYLLHGTDFGTDNEKIIWERTPFAIYFEEETMKLAHYSMHPVQF